MPFDQLLPAYAPGLSTSDKTAILALCWAVQDARPDMDEVSILKSLLRWNGADWRDNGRRLLAGAGNVVSVPAAHSQPQRQRAGSMLTKMLLAVSVLVTANMILFGYIQTRKAQSAIEDDHETAAAISLYHAGELSGDNRIQWLRAVVAEHPGTSAAKDAQAELDALPARRK